jgi:type I restriction enzyme S subunit
MKAKNWPKVSFEDIAASSHYPIGDGDHGAIKPAMYTDSGIPYIRVADIGDGELLKEKMVFISPVIHRNNPKSHLYPNDIIISKTGATIGKVALIPPDMKEANTTSSVGKVTVDPKKANPRFILQFMRSPPFQRAMWAVSHKSAQPGFNIKDLKQFKIPLPPLTEQERIVNLLDEADELRKLRAQADRHSTALIPALFHEMFGNAELHCPSVTIEEAVEQFIDYRGKTPEKSLSGVALVTAKIVTSGRILPPTEYIPEENYDSWMRRGLPRTGDVLFTMEAPLGEVAMVKETHIALAQRILLMRPQANILDSCYFMTALKMPCVWKQIEERATGSTVRGIRQAELRKITMPVPPLPLQKEFAKRVSEIRELEAAQAVSRQRVEHLFQSMLHRAFNQEL